MNILWICTDQQRWDSLGCYGNPVIDTPNIDNLAHGGALFQNCYAQSPVCAPSRGAFLTGRYPRTCGMRQNGASIRPSEVLVTKMLADQGYICGLSGKLHLNPCHPSVCPGMERRIDDGYAAFYWSHHSAPDDKGCNWPLNDYNIWLRQRDVSYRTRPYQSSPYIQEGMPQELHQTTYCTEKAIDFIRANAVYGNRWLFSVNYFDPHHDFDPPKDLMDKYMARLDQIPLPNYVEGELAHKPIFQQIDHRGAYGGNGGHAYTEMTDRDRKMHTAAYYAMIDLIDRQVGRLVEALRETGQYENTVVIFMSDHGEMLGDHGIYLKGPYFYDCMVKVPLIISCPGLVRKSVKAGGLVELMDMAQTVLAIAGIQKHPGMMGKSLWDICTGRQNPDHHKDLVYSEYYNAMPWHRNPLAFCTMAFDGRYKIVRCHGTSQGELYDLTDDPTETANLWDRSDSLSLKCAMMEKLSDAMAFTCDPLSERVAPW